MLGKRDILFGVIYSWTKVLILLENPKALSENLYGFPSSLERELFTFSPTNEHVPGVDRRRVNLAGFL